MRHLSTISRSHCSFTHAKMPCSAPDKYFTESTIYIQRYKTSINTKLGGETPHAFLGIHSPRHLLNGSRVVLSLWAARAAGPKQFACHGTPIDIMAFLQVVGGFEMNERRASERSPDWRSLDSSDDPFSSSIGSRSEAEKDLDSLEGPGGRTPSRPEKVELRPRNRDGRELCGDAVLTATEAVSDLVELVSSSLGSPLTNASSESFFASKIQRYVVPVLTGRLPETV